jgi:hypothetical protein
MLVAFIPALHWLGKTLQDVDGSPSSKRVVIFLALFFLMILSCVSIFANYHIDSFVLESFRDIVIAGLGFTGIEKFSNRPHYPPDKKKEGELPPSQ